MTAIPARTEFIGGCLRSARRPVMCTVVYARSTRSCNMYSRPFVLLACLRRSVSLEGLALRKQELPDHARGQGVRRVSGSLFVHQAQCYPRYDPRAMSLSRGLSLTLPSTQKKNKSPQNRTRVERVWDSRPLNPPVAAGKSPRGAKKKRANALCTQG